MNITDTRTDNKVKFSEIKIGDVFKYNKEYYIKTQAVYRETVYETGWGYDVYDTKVNALKLSNGHMHAFNTYEFVEPVDHELIIK